MSEDMNDDEMMMDQMALECMHAMENKDKEMFKHSFHVLVADILDKLSGEMEMKEEG